jgi:aminopeptidase N
MPYQKPPFSSILSRTLHTIVRSVNIFALFFFVLLFAMLTGCKRSTRTFFHDGVSAELARYRARQIYDVDYRLHFTIPEQKNKPVTGKVTISFKPLKARHGVILDFTPGEEHLHNIKVNGTVTEAMIMNGHIYLDANGLVPRQINTIEIDFTASDQALNRSDDFMYTLFVPDRASTAFPCFDQPDIKATFGLSLDIPARWEALSNGRETRQEVKGEHKTVHFAAGNPISTYLFAFTAGEFQILSQTYLGRTLRLFHRETDQQKIDENVQAIFDQHFSALRWMERYTGIPYPYDKFDMALLPGFQYSGMEHPGAVWYRDTRLLLDPNPPLTTLMRKASLIAHETAHMWFGNLVTMQWFDDVWLKEVFAGFMADKIVEEQFPDQEHRLRFLLTHYPRAMSIDRTPGTHPIKQQLANMKLAGTLYGPIIYNKAPIVFEQLERIMQPEVFRTAVQEYLLTYAHANADWSDLVTIFDKHSTQNIAHWSQVWIYGKGLPHIQTESVGAPDRLSITLHPPKTDSGRFPAQYLGISIPGKENQFNKMAWFDSSPLEVETNTNSTKPQLTLLNGLGWGYGFFELHRHETDYIIDNIQAIDDEIHRAAISINMFENFLNGKTDQEAYFRFLHKALTHETDQLLQNYLLDNLNIWALNFPYYHDNAAAQRAVEDLLWEKVTSSPAAVAELFFEQWIKFVRTSESINKMRALYLGELTAGALKISDQNLTQLALEAALRDPGNHDLPEKELKRMTNPDRLRRLKFILPAISSHKEDRDLFFSTLKEPANRNPEPWVLEALYFLHHPLHPQQGLDYIPESLQMLKEIQKTGDIFFPQNWLTTTLQNYSNPQAAQMVQEYLNTEKDLEENLKLKLLQASDILIRSSETQ